MDADAVVVGSGVGGLGAAALLAKAGKRVLVLERHDVAGGLTHTFRRKGFEWDVGLHYLGKVHDPADPLRRVFDHVTDGALQWAPMARTYDHVVVGDDRYGFVAGRAALEDALGSTFPRERAAIRAYLDRVRAVARQARGHFTERALPGPIAWLARPFLGRAFRREAARTTGEVLRSLTSDRRLAAVLAGRWGNYGLPPGRSSFAMHALVADFYLEGGSYPVGGARKIAESIVPVIERAGGRVKLSAPVERIEVRDGRAIGVQVDGELVTAPIVVSNAGLRATVALLPPRDRAAFDGAVRLPLSAGHVALYLGLGRDPGLDAANRWIHPSDDLDGAYDRWRAGGDLPFVFVSSPSANDPLASRPTVTALAPAAWERFREWHGTRWRRRGDDYEALKERLADTLLAVVQREWPGLDVVHRELSTPLSTAHFVAHPEGAIYGLDHGPARFAEHALRPATPIPGLWLVGQDVTTVGVGSALMSAVLAASGILRRDVLSSVVRETRVPALATT